ncbi:MAG: RES family NAD+ phosphorylase [Deltaproteobacteria bacterium]|nr:RES family NAD+ phosphorylase [Deltaproteobacteria bacterium]
MRKDDTIIQEQVGLSDQLGCSLTRGATGRTTNYESPEHNRQEALVKQWAEAENREAFLMHPTAEKFGSIISEAPVINGTTLVCYRGCYRRPDMLPHPLPHHFGPPPPEHTDAGRYNIAGKPVLYLCTTKYGAAYEKQEDSNPIKDLFCQEYLLDLAVLRLADFADPSLDNFIQIVFDYAEYGIRDGKINKDEYLFSQAVAAIIGGKGFSGILVPGVRGTPERRYQNIVIFNPGEIWGKFVNMDMEPERIDSILSN